MCQLFATSGQSIGASASISVLSMNIQGWFSSGLIDLLAVQGTLKSLSPAPQCESISSLVLSLLYGPILTSIHDYWKDCAAAAAKSRRSCPTLCDPIDGSPPGSRPWDSLARTLEWAAISFSSAWKWKMKVKSLSHVWLFATPWTVAYQAPPSMGFSRQEYWSGVPLPSPGKTIALIINCCYED